MTLYLAGKRKTIFSLIIAAEADKLCGLSRDLAFHDHSLPASTSVKILLTTPRGLDLQLARAAVVGDLVAIKTLLAQRASVYV